MRPVAAVDIDSQARHALRRTVTMEEKLAVDFLNTLAGVPSALLVSSIQDLQDGHVLVDIVGALQTHVNPTALPIQSLSSALEWLLDVAPRHFQSLSKAAERHLTTLRRTTGLERCVLSGDNHAIASVVGLLQDICPPNLGETPRYPPQSGWGYSSASRPTPSMVAGLPISPGEDVNMMIADAPIEAWATEQPQPSDSAMVLTQQPRLSTALYDTADFIHSGAAPPHARTGNSVRFSDEVQVAELPPPPSASRDTRSSSRTSTAGDKRMLTPEDVRAMIEEFSGSVPAQPPQAARSRHPHKRSSPSPHRPSTRGAVRRTGTGTSTGTGTGSGTGSGIGSGAGGLGAKHERFFRLVPRAGSSLRRQKSWDASTTLGKEVAAAGATGASATSPNREPRAKRVKRRPRASGLKRSSQQQTGRTGVASLVGGDVVVDDTGLKVSTLVDPTYTKADMARLENFIVKHNPPKQSVRPVQHREHRRAPKSMLRVEDLRDQPECEAASTEANTGGFHESLEDVKARALMEIDVANARAGIPPSPPPHFEVKDPALAPDGPEVFRVGTTSSALTKQQLEILDWIVRELKVPVVPKPSHGGHQGRIRVSTTAVAKAMRDGVFLCELVAAAESKRGTRIRVSVSAPDADGRKRLTLPGVSHHPRTTAAVTKNVNRALGVLRKNAHMPTRHMWSGEELRKGNVQVMWELLSDIHKCYALPRRTRKATTRNSKKDKRTMQSTQRAATKGTHRHASGTGGFVRPTPLPNTHGDPIEDEDVMTEDFVDAPTRGVSHPGTHTRHTAAAGGQTSGSRAAAVVPPPSRHRKGQDSSSTLYKGAGEEAGSGALTVAKRGPAASSHKRTRASRRSKQPAMVAFGDGVAGITEDASFAPMSNDQVKEVRAWLQSLGVGLNREEEEAFVLDNPLCNGVLLCEVANTVVPKPRTSAARGNVEKGLAKLRSQVPVGTPVPSQYLWNTEALLKGNMDAVWGLFFHLKDAFPNAKPQAFPSRRVGGVVKAAGTRAGYAAIPRLPYSTNDVWRLERSILSWLFSLGVLRDFTPSGVPRDLQVIDEVIRNGCLLCDLVAALGGRPVVAVFRRPKTPAARMSNLRKAFEGLRRLPSISQTYLRSTEAFASGDVNAVLGLLEACHMWYDGVVPSKKSDAPPVPYFGSHVPPERPEPPVEELPAQTEEKGEVGDLEVETMGATTDGDIYMPGPGAGDAHFGVGDLFPAPALAPLSAPVEMQPLSSELQPQGPTLQDTLRTDIARAVPVDSTHAFSLAPPAPPSQASGATRPPRPPGRTRGSRIPSLRRTSSARRDVAGSHATASHGGFDQDGAASVGASTVDSEVALRTNTVATLVEWLAGLNIALQEPWTLTADQAPEFCDGLVLARIVETLDHTRGGIAGLERNPTTSAAKLQNVRRSLEVLRNKKEMPMELLWSDTAIRNGDSSVIVKLLSQMRKAYGHHLLGPRRHTAT